MNINFTLNVNRLGLNTADERLGLPSASSAHILSRCPGSWRMSHGKPGIARFANLSDRGTRIHAILAKEIEPVDEPWTDEEKAAASNLDAQCLEVVEKWADVNMTPPSLDMSEVRLYLRAGLMPVTSGRFDRLYVQTEMTGNGKHGLIIDFKTGWADLGELSENEQLMVYALLVASDYPEMKSISVAIVREVGKPFFFTYSEEHIKSAAFAWGKTLEEVFGEDPRIVAGSHCTFCRAQHTCPALRATVDAMAVSSVLAEKWETVSPIKKLQLFQQSKAAAAFIKTLNELIKQDLRNDPNSIPGLCIGKGKKNKEFDRANEAYKTAIQAGLSHEEFMEAVKISFAQVRDALAKKKGWKKKDADGNALVMFKGNITINETQGAIENA